MALVGFTCAHPHPPPYICQARFYNVGVSSSMNIFLLFAFGLIYFFAKETWLKNFDCHWAYVYTSVSVRFRLIAHNYTMMKTNFQMGSFFLVTAAILHTALLLCTVHILYTEYLRRWDNPPPKPQGKHICTGAQQLHFKLNASQ